MREQDAAGGGARRSQVPRAGWLDQKFEFEFPKVSGSPTPPSFTTPLLTIQPCQEAGVVSGCMSVFKVKCHGTIPNLPSGKSYNYDRRKI